MFCLRRYKFYCFPFTCFIGVLIVVCVFNITSRTGVNGVPPDIPRSARTAKPYTAESAPPKAPPRVETLVSGDCQPLHFIPHAESRPLTALASYPGSGNTWLRHLIQQSTGVLTGSQYVDKRLLVKGFPGEAVSDSSVAVVKTHEWRPKTQSLFQKAVLLIRPPKPALQSFFNLWGGGHTGFAPKFNYMWGRGQHWKRYFDEQIVEWRSLNLAWLHNFTGPLHVVLYDQLMQDLGPTLRSLVQFLNLPLDEAALQCALDRPEGLHHRQPRKDNYDPFTDEMKKTIRETEQLVFTELEKFLNDKPSSNYLALLNYLKTHELINQDEEIE